MGFGHRAAAASTALVAFFILAALASVNYLLPSLLPGFKPVPAQVLMAAGLATLFSATFILSLIAMDWMTATAHRRHRLKSSEPLGVLDRGEFRRALTVSFTVVFFTVLSLSLTGVVELNAEGGVMDLFAKAFLVVIAFYFGGRAVERGVELYAARKAEVKEKPGSGHGESSTS